MLHFYFHSYSVPFPHLVLLCSGGHCILAIVDDVNHYTILGQSLDDSPGDAFDKCARMMCLDLHPDVAGLCGGMAIEKLAERGDPTKIDIMDNPVIMFRRCV